MMCKVYKKKSYTKIIYCSTFDSLYNGHHDILKTKILVDILEE